MQDIQMVGEIDYAASTIVGYLKKDQIYYVHGNRFGSFVRWDDIRVPDVTDAQTIEAAGMLQTETSRRCANYHEPRFRFGTHCPTQPQPPDRIHRFNR